MNPAILIIANLVLFVAFIFAGFITCSLLTKALIGFFDGGRLACFTPEDAISQRKHNRLTASLVVASVALSGLLFWLLGSNNWSCFVLSPTLATLIGIAASFKFERQRLLPFGWKSR